MASVPAAAPVGPSFFASKPRPSPISKRKLPRPKRERVKGRRDTRRSQGSQENLPEKEDRRLEVVPAAFAEEEGPHEVVVCEGVEDWAGEVEDIEIVRSDRNWIEWVKDLNQDNTARHEPEQQQDEVARYEQQHGPGEELDQASDSLAPRPKPSLLTRSFVYKHLKALNERVGPVLERKPFLVVYKEALKAVEGFLQRPLEEVFEEAQELIVGDLFWAKQELKAERGEQGLWAGESGEEVLQQEHWCAENKAGAFDKMDAPMLGQFLVALNGFIQVKNETQLADYLVLEPPFGAQYGRMIQELKQQYPKGNEGPLENKCSQALPAAREGEDGAPWTQFIKFMVQYLCYMRDIDGDPSKYLQTYDLLSELQVRANSALTHATLGHLVLPVVVRCARLVCRLAIGLDKQPQLIAHLKSGQPGATAGGDDGGTRETLPERAANTLRTGFVTCLQDRSSGINPATGRPEGKKRGIYTIANLCLKILFQCNKTRNATQIFSNISNLSPPISAYSKRERVTYLYYLGRFYWQNSHFYRAQIVLQRAYDEAPARPECVRQRRYILVYLMASNIILGRFPSETLLSRPEAHGLAERFLPLCYAIRQGDLASFRRHLDFDGEHADWFLHFRILLQLRNRCEVLVWRSLIRKVFILAGTTPDASGGSRAAPTVNIRDLVTAFTFMEKRAIFGSTQSANGEDYIDPDFSSLDLPPDIESLLPDPTTLESILSSLIDQGFLGGFISHRMLKFAITGSKSKGGPLAAGFPRVWEVVKRRAEQEEQGGSVPGWKREKDGVGGGGFGPGMVVHLSGARPVGAAFG